MEISFVLLSSEGNGLFNVSKLYFFVMAPSRIQRFYTGHSRSKISLLECSISHELYKIQVYYRFFHPLATHSFCGMHPPLADRMNPRRQKHAGIHWYVQNCGGRLPQIIGQAVPHQLKTSSLPHIPENGLPRWPSTTAASKTTAASRKQS